MRMSGSGSGSGSGWVVLVLVLSVVLQCVVLQCVAEGGADSVPALHYSHTTTSTTNNTNNSGVKSWCEMRSEGERSAFCCFKGHMLGKCLPSFIIAGTQKSGTTALAATLSSHPQVSFAKRKELHFFDRKKEYSKGITHYLDSFNFWNFAADSTVLPHFAEATPFYIASRHACRRISETVPEVKIIVLLREPVARAYSEYQMKKRRVDSQNDFITLVHKHTRSLYYCLLGYSYNWTDIEGCSPELLVQHEHWGKFISSVSRILTTIKEREKRTNANKSIDDIPIKREAMDEVELKDKTKDMESARMKIWAEMMLTCFSPTPEEFWEKESKSTTATTKRHVRVRKDEMEEIENMSKHTNFSNLELSTYNDIFSSWVPPILRSQGSFSFPPPASSQGLPSPEEFSLNLKKQQWQNQWGWISDVHIQSSELIENSNTSFLPSSTRHWRNRYYFQPLKCLAGHARETLTPLEAAFENELHALNSCAGGKFIHGSLEEMDEALDSCLTVHSGISNQYLYRSLYGVQIQHCLKYIPRNKILFLPSESLKGENSILTAMLKIKKFLNISLFDSSSTAATNVQSDTTVGNRLGLRSIEAQKRINEKFPGFEKSSGWRLESKYDPMPKYLNHKLSTFFRRHNEKLFRLIGEDYTEFWK